MTAEQAMAEALRTRNLKWEAEVDGIVTLRFPNAAEVIAALRAAGWAVVPVEITDKMAEAALHPIVYNGRGEGMNPDPKIAWRRIIAMLRAAAGGG